MATRNLDEARKAYELGNVDLSKKAHDSKQKGEEHKKGGEYIKSFVYSGLDGIITTFAIVAGTVGSSLGSGIVIILGVSNVFGDALSMAFADYLSTKSELEVAKAEREREQWEVENYPEGEKKEMVELYMAKGMEEEDAKVMVDTLSKHPKAWVDVMMVEELGILDDNASPVKNGLVSFFSFILLGFFPLLPFLIGHAVDASSYTVFYISLGITCITLFALGVFKARFSDVKAWKSGLETLIIGVIAAGASYLVGYLLEPLENDN